MAEEMPKFRESIIKFLKRPPVIVFFAVLFTLPFARIKNAGGQTFPSKASGQPLSQTAPQSPPMAQDDGLAPQTAATPQQPALVVLYGASQETKPQKMNLFLQIKEKTSLRKEPGDNADLIMKLPKDTYVLIDAVLNPQNTKQQEWCPVEILVFEQASQVPVVFAKGFIPRKVLFPGYPFQNGFSQVTTETKERYSKENSRLFNDQKLTAQKEGPPASPPRPLLLRQGIFPAGLNGPSPP